MPAEFDVDEFLEKLILIEQVEKGTAELKAGKGIQHSKVMAADQSLRSKTRKR